MISYFTFYEILLIHPFFLFLQINKKRRKLRMNNIRNFCIIAHIDHGKSTLADRLLEFTNTVAGKEMQAQVLDNMDLERERGITIKSHAIQMNYKHKGEEYVLNLIDTPGHVDFSYEVSRSIAACEGALLIVDATQGIQAQTISNLYMALEDDLEIIPILNKMDMDNAMPEEVEDQIVELLGCKPEEIIRASGKTGMGVDEILEAIIERIPAPKGDPEAPLQCLIFDSVFNSFRGIIAYFKIVNGTIKKDDLVKFVNTGKEYYAEEIGVLKLDLLPTKTLSAGNVGYIISGIKTSKEVKVGDTITHVKRPCDTSIAGFQEVKPMVFAGVYPIDTEDFEDLRASIEKLQLNDASLTFEAESSVALGFGFRCGFLGMLHMEIIQERLDREFNMNVITTVPNVSYKVYTKRDELFEVHNPSGLPDIILIDRIEEPFIRASIITRTDYIGQIMTLCLGKRGELIKQNYISGNRMELIYDLPLGEIVFDFYDKLKSISKGYASFDYHMNGFRPSRLVKLDILLNGEPVDALSSLIHADNALSLGRRMCEKLKELIPRQQFDIAVQAAIGAKIIARETIKAVRKDVTAKCYGGDITRKRKLLEKQKKGKKRMKQIGNVEVPQKAFLAVLKLD
jgi:GTP-binding protein LepA